MSDRVLACRLFFGLIDIVALFMAQTSVSIVHAEQKEEEAVTLAGGHATQKFLAGERVEIRNTRVSDDVFAAGRDLIANDVVAEDIVAAEYTLSFQGLLVDDFILAGAG